MNKVDRNCILTAEAAQRKLHRMALEIIEQNAAEDSFIIAGIIGNGEVVAKSLMKAIQNITHASLLYLTIHLDKKNPLDASISPEAEINEQVVLIVDDVANSGRTMLYALKPFLQFRPKKIQTVTLVERSHKLFPIQSDYVGVSLSTTLQEHIVVETNGEEITGAWLQ
ncbi:MAG: phosphoribosyltransferase [Flavisolibacter sp.]|nr:phosphoribosyltransferase [Flavisolibacter sp.]MBD0376974.1 phosphoribosyltransferase [Flavisolibacter sp.]